MRLCRCGVIVEDRCSKCQKQTAKKTADRGYDNRWRTLSERYRANWPLCQVCEANERIVPASQVHHIVKVTDAPELRLDPDNLLSVCEKCHVWIEDKPEEARKIKQNARDDC